MKREVLVSAVLLLAVIAGTVMFFVRHDDVEVRTDAMNAIPSEVILAIESDQIDTSLQLFQRNTLLAQLVSDSIMSALSGELQTLRTELVNVSDESSPSFILCLTRVTQQKNGLLLLGDFPGVDEMTSGFFDSSYTLEPLVDYWEISHGDKRFYGFLQDGVLALSMHQLAIEGSLQSLSSGEGPPFDLTILEGSKEMLWFNFSSLYWMLPKMTNGEAMGLGTALEGIGATGCYRYSIDEQSINLYGSVVPNSLNSKLLSRNFGKPSKLASLSVLPERVAFFYGYSGLDFDTRVRVLELDSSFKSAVNSIESTYHFDFLDDLVPMVDSEFVYGAVDPINHELYDHSFLAFPIADEERFVSIVNSMDTSTKRLLIDSFEVSKLPDSRLVELFFGDVYSQFRSPYCIIREGVCLLANSEEVLKTLSGSISQGRVLASSIEFEKALDQMTEESNFLFFVQPYYARGMVRDVLEKEYNDWYRRNSKTIGSVDQFVFQLTKTGDKFYSHVRCVVGEGRATEELVLWDKEFSHPITYGPYAVKNYITKRYELICADAKGDFSMINQDGEISWTRPTGAAGSGRPYEIDIYGNKKIQYLVTSGDELVAIDRRGRVVSGYPIKLPDALSGEIAVFDLLGNRDYQMLAPCKGNKLLGYTAKGRPMSGWNPVSLKANGIGRMQFFAKGNKSYYFMADEEGNVYLWNSKGKKIQEPIATEQHFVSDFTMQFASELENCKLLALEATGKLARVSLAGETSLLDLPVNWPDAKGFWSDLNGDNSKDLVLWKGTSVAVFSQSMKEVLRVTSENEVLHVQVLDAKAKGQLLAVHTKGEIVHLFDSAGRELKNSPLPSTSGSCALIDVDDDGSFELIIGNGQKVVAHKGIY